MDKTRIIQDLLRVAEALDQEHLFDQSDALTKVAEDLVGSNYDGAAEDYLDVNRGDWELGEDRYEQEQALMREIQEQEMASEMNSASEMGVDSAYKVIEELMPNYANLSAEERALLDQAQSIVSDNKPSMKLPESDFTQALENGGAKVINPKNNLFE